MIKYVRRFFWWLLDVDRMLALIHQRYASFMSTHEYYVTSRVNDAVERCFKARKEPVYVTLRGFFIDIDHKRIAHGWTQRVDLSAGGSCSLPFQPYNLFTCERVDILGPAEITGVCVGSFAQTQSNYANPTTIAFEAVCEVGNCIMVHLRSTL